VRTDPPFAGFARRLTFGYAAVAIVLIATVVAVSSVLAFVLYIGILNQSVRAASDRARSLATQYETRGETLAEFAPDLVNELAEDRIDVVVFDDEHHQLAGQIPPMSHFHAMAGAFGLHPAFANVLGGTIVVAPDVEGLAAFFARYVAIVVPISALAIILASLVGQRITRRAILPLADVTQSLRRIAGGDFTPEPLLQGNAELQDLTTAYNEVALRLTAATAERERNELQMRHFIADAGHELRTPLTVIMGYLEILQNGAVSDAEGVTRVHATMLGESRRMRVVIDKLILLARLERPAAPHLVRLDAAALAAQVIAALTPILGDRLSLTADGPAPIDADENELFEAVKNVVENAGHYAPGSPIEIGVSTALGRTSITVADRGPGMDAQDLEHAFDRFYRGSARTASEGSGLGLSIAKRAVERSGGSIAIESRLGKGTRVTLVVPAAAEG
jgi:two-component system, OmpR family, sensor kinase